MFSSVSARWYSSRVAPARSGSTRTAYIVWKIDLRQTAHVLANASVGWWLAAFAIWVVSVWPLSWRWQRLLASSEVHERLGWLVRTTFVSYGAAQVLPTSLGGDASRIYETTRRHPGVRGPVAGTVLLERALGGVATLVLAAAGFLLAVGRYSVGGYVWVELAFVVLSLLEKRTKAAATLRTTKTSSTQR